MKKTTVIILAAGYATRLYPLTLTYPKSLLPVSGKPIVEHTIDNLSRINNISKIHLVSNDKFFSQFEKWLKNYRETKKTFEIELTNDGSTDESNKLGAIGDLHLVINRKKIDDDIIVIAGDNLFSDSLESFFSRAREIKSPILGVYNVGSLEDTKKFSSISVNSEGRITAFEEKPTQPKSSLIGIALYHYPKSTFFLINQYVKEGNNPDQPGRLVEWLHSRIPFYTHQISGDWHDVGSKEVLDKVNQTFGKN